MDVLPLFIITQYGADDDYCDGCHSSAGNTSGIHDVVCDTENKQPEENLSYEESTRISNNQVSAVIGAYMKNIRAQIGIDNKLQNVSKVTERRVLKYNIENIIHDRIAREKRKLKKS